MFGGVENSDKFVLYMDDVDDVGMMVSGSVDGVNGIGDVELVYGWKFNSNNVSLLMVDSKSVSVSAMSPISSTFITGELSKIMLKWGILNCDF